MGYLLIWLEAMASSVLLVAVVTAWASRRSRAWLRVGLPIAMALAVLAIAGALVAGSIWLRYALIVPDWLWYTLSWAVVFTAAAVVVIVCGLRAKEGAAAARLWPTGRLLVAFVAAGALGLITFWNMDLAIEIQLAAVRAESGALALTVAPARVPDNLNAALVYQRAFDSIRRFEDLPREWGETWSYWVSDTPRRGSNDPDNQVPPFNPADAGLRKFLAEHERTLALLRQAATMPDCYFERLWGRPSIDMLLPEYGLLRQAAVLLAVDARVKAADGNVRGAVEDLTAIFSMAAHVRAEPLVIAALVAMSVDTIGQEVLQGVLASGRLGPDDLAAIRLDETVSYQRVMGRAFLMEEAFGLSCFTLLAPETDYSVLALFELGMPSINPTVFGPVLSVWRVYLMPADLASYRRLLRDYREQCGQPYYKNREAWEATDERFNRREFGIMTRLVAPALSRAVVKAVEADAGHRLTRAALAAAAYRARNGKYPARLQDLMPDFLTEVPLDPFDGKPLRMAAREDGAVVFYSVGRDSKDDGGAPWDDETKTGDVTFRLGPPAPAAADR